MIRLNCEVYVPGHGPVTSANGVAAVKLFTLRSDETTFNQGLSVVEAANQWI